MVDVLNTYQEGGGQSGQEGTSWNGKLPMYGYL